MLIHGVSVHKLSSYVPDVPTPFGPDGEIDYAALEAFCGKLVQQGAHGLAVCGVIGEAPTLTRVEHEEIIRVAAQVSHGQVPVIAAACANATDDAIALARDAETAGANALLTVVPYYNKPTQEGMRAHFEAIAGATDLPVILHDEPARCGCGLADDTIVRLAENRRIIGLNDATGDLARLSRLRLRLDPRFRLLSGDDATAPAYIASGGNGCISMTANVAPGLCRDLYLAYRNGHAARAQRLEPTIARLTSVLLRESSPASLKYALCLLGIMSSTLRLPLVEPSEQTKADVTEAMAHLCQYFADDLIDDTGIVSPGGIRQIAI